MPTRPRVVLTLACAVAVLAPTGRLTAQASVAAPLTLADVVRSTLAGNTDVRVSLRGVDVGRAAAMLGAAAFDAQVQTTVTGSSDNALQYAPDVTAADVQATTTRKLGYAVSWQRRLHNGLVLTPQVGVTSVDVPGQFAAPQGRATVALGLLVPLLRDRNGVLSRSAERAALSTYDATVFDLRQAAAAGVRQAVGAYWSYVASRRQLAVHAESEQRAERLLAQTEALVQADERPRTDLTPLRGNVAAKRASRIAAEQAVADAWAQLALLMALPSEAVGTPPATATELPEPAAADGARLAALDVSALTAAALARRADVAAAGRRTDAARLAWHAAEHALRSPLNLSVQAGYAGLQRGRALDNLYGPFWRNRSRVNVSVQLSYALPTTNAAARGEALQAAALLEQQQLLQRDAERRVGAGVTVAAQALGRSRLRLADAATAVTIADETVRNERRKFQLGTSTVFDVLLAEDNVTSARLAELSARVAYAVALATLRYETGTLVGGEGAALTVDSAALLTTP